MGDSLRNKKFAKWIHENFQPKEYPNVLVLADGLGELSYELLARKYNVVSYEGKPRLIRRKLGKRSVDFSYNKKYFEGNEKIPNLHLVVAMHPDEASDIALQYAKDNKLPFAIVPCCNKSFKVQIKGDLLWWRYLRSIVKDSYELRETLLSIRGKNKILYSRKLINNGIESK